MFEVYFSLLVVGFFPR